MALNQTAQPASGRRGGGSRSGLSRRRLALVAAISGVCFVGGFYLGVYVLTARVGFGDLHGWLFLVVTVPLGGLLAGLGAALAGPSTPRLLGPTVAAGLLTAAVVSAVLVAIGAGFGLAIAIGGISSLLATDLTVSFVATRSRARRLSQSGSSL